MSQEIGYSRYRESIESAPDLTKEQKEVWKKFEEIRQALYEKYRELIQKNTRFSNSLLESAIREITCRESNNDLTEVINQWKEVIERYAKNELAKEGLIKVLTQFS